MTPFDFGVWIKVESEYRPHHQPSRDHVAVQHFAHPLSLLDCKVTGHIHHVTLMDDSDPVITAKITARGIDLQFGDIKNSSGHSEVATSFEEVSAIIWTFYDHKWSYKDFKIDHANEKNTFWKYIGHAIIAQFMGTIMKCTLLSKEWNLRARKHDTP